MTASTDCNDHENVTYGKGELRDATTIWITHRFQCTGCTACVRINEKVQLDPA